MVKRSGMLLGILAVLLSVAAVGFGQVVENPAKPKAANAWRVVVPQEVLAISDEGTSDYYFKWPYRLRTGPDGSLVLRDRDQVLRFDKDGRFLHNLFKKGQGPGEMQYAGDSLFIGERVVVHSSYNNKLVTFDGAGKFEKEMPVRPDVGTSLALLHHRAGTYYFSTSEFPRTSGDPKIVETPQTIVAVSETTGEVQTLTTFIAKAWVVTSSGGGAGMFGIVSLTATPFREGYLALTHTEEYLIKIYDPAANKIIREFRRAYERVKGEPLTEAEKKGGIFLGDKHYTRPERKFENDVRNILVRGDEIWAVTSTKDKAKGVLIDVFDSAGAYRDCFWLKLPEAALKSVISPGSCALDGDFLWVVERSEDETFAIKKYRVVT